MGLWAATAIRRVAKASFPPEIIIMIQTAPIHRLVARRRGIKQLGERRLWIEDRDKKLLRNVLKLMSVIR